MSISIEVALRRVAKRLADEFPRDEYVINALLAVADEFMPELASAPSPSAGGAGSSAGADSPPDHTPQSDYAAVKCAAESFLNDYEQDKATLDSWTLAEYFIKALSPSRPVSGKEGKR